MPIGNPEGPYWTFHAVSVPPAVHAKSAELKVILFAVKDCEDGAGQEIHDETSIKSIAKSPVKVLPVVYSNCK